MKLLIPLYPLSRYQLVRVHTILRTTSTIPTICTSTQPISKMKYFSFYTKINLNKDLHTLHNPLNKNRKHPHPTLHHLLLSATTKVLAPPYHPTPHKVSPTCLPSPTTPKRTLFTQRSHKFNPFCI